jgi:hypothetical protein
MADDEIRYDLLTQDALRGVIRQVLTLVQRDGLPGQHHLYIAFDTEGEGVAVSKRLKEQYPDEMTIVLQYQFWDLQVTNDRFEVKLSFGSVPERLVVPFHAVKAFYDPSAQFGAAAYGGGDARSCRRVRGRSIGAPAARATCGGNRTGRGRTRAFAGRGRAARSLPQEITPRLHQWRPDSPSSFLPHAARRLTGGVRCFT